MGVMEAGLNTVEQTLTEGAIKWPCRRTRQRFALELYDVVPSCYVSIYVGAPLGAAGVLFAPDPYPFYKYSSPPSRGSCRDGELS